MSIALVMIVDDQDDCKMIVSKKFSCASILWHILA